MRLCASRGSNCYAAFVIDIFVRNIFGRRVSNSMTAIFAPDDFKYTLRRRSAQDGGIPIPGRSIRHFHPMLRTEGGFRHRYLGPLKAAGQVEWEALNGCAGTPNSDTSLAIGCLKPTEWSMHSSETEGT